MNELALFAGAGGGILGGSLLGWKCVCAVEINRYAASVLVARQNDGCLPQFPIWDDVQTFDGKPWREVVDVVTGGFPCQDISAAGTGKGITGSKSGLWKHMARIIGDVRPRFVWVENSPMLLSRGLDVVLGDLSSLGYDARWGIVGAHHAGAPHKRDRIWVVANANCAGCERKGPAQSTGRDDAAVATGTMSQVSDTACEGWRLGEENEERSRVERGFVGGESWWDVEPELGRVADGVANRVDRIKAIGNGQVPAVVKLAWEALNS